MRSRGYLVLAIPVLMFLIATCPDNKQVDRDLSDEEAAIDIARELTLSPTWAADWARADLYDQLGLKDKAAITRTLAGWVNSRRDHGGLTFPVYRDREAPECYSAITAMVTQLQKELAKGHRLANVRVELRECPNELGARDAIDQQLRNANYPGPLSELALKLAENDGKEIQVFSQWLSELSQAVTQASIATKTPTS